MQKLVLTFSPKYNLYLLDNYYGNISFLHYLFTDIQPYNINDYIKWITESNENEGSTNSTWFKKDASYILIGSLFSDEPGGGPCFKVSMEQFVQLLKEWKKLAEAKTPQITITEDNGILTITPG